MTKKIYFYSWAKEYFEFSNFSKHPIEIDGKVYPTNEHYFQAMKFSDEDYAEQIRLAKTPAEAKKMGLSRVHKIHSDWDEKRVEVMRVAVEAKFTQHKDLLKYLVGTYPSTLIEDSPTDSFWGCGKDRKGHNALGKLLMAFREEVLSDMHECPSCGQNRPYCNKCV